MWAYSCEPADKSEYGEQMLGGELVRPAWSGHPGNVPISNGKYCWRPDFHKRPIPPFLSALQTDWGMRGGPTRGGGYWKLYGIWRAVVRVGWRKVVWAGSQGWVYVYCSTTQREAFLHSPPGIVATATLDQFAHSLTNWWSVVARHQSPWNLFFAQEHFRKHVRTHCVKCQSKWQKWRVWWKPVRTHHNVTLCWHFVQIIEISPKNSCCRIV